MAAAALAVLAAGAAWFFFLRDAGPGANGLIVDTAAVEQRNLSRVVASSGRIAPLVTVEVGSQLSGQIEALNVDFNDRVSAGQELARLDPQTFATRVREAEANLEVARAQVSVSQANAQRARSELTAAQRAYERAVSLRERGTFSEAQFDNAQTAFNGAQANVAVADANLRNARAGLAQREASLESAQVDLERTFIRSPIEGVVIDRRIDVGQTVAASLNAPILFLIAQDLSRVQIEAQIDEADIGDISNGQTVTFDVDAYPGISFEGVVTQVRLAAQEAQNVVTYTVVIQADNPRQRLLPGMTANVTIVTGTVDGALAAPNLALRFTPRGAAEALVADTGAQPARGERGARGGGGRGGGPDQMINQLAEDLDLTDAQRRDVQRALQDAFTRMRAQAQAGGGGGGGGGGAAFQAQMRSALAQVLTADQMTRYDALAAERAGQRQDVRRGTLWVQTADGRIEARQVGLGLSDGQFTQLVGGGLEAGERVVVRVREAG
ncbi:MAG: efflux RND transporter periplasmic adaptor subunit [Oceanicaulis sp.]|nr:efflux RND transporter periplasmic adaptor subunit [Oceanicaulis sp.]